jgi:RNA polymerase sigma factor (sigma-70 family)
MSATHMPTPEQLDLLARVVHAVTRQSRMADEDAEDFAQTVQLRLLERDYDIFHRFDGRSTLRTYLVVVVKRMLLDWQNRVYGKWRPSTAAVRSGAVAVLLEQQIGRNRLSVDEAVAVASMRADAPSPVELRRLASSLPCRPLRRHVSVDAIDEIHGGGFLDPVEDRERQADVHRAHRCLRRALQCLSPEDRRLIRLRFAERRTVRSVAEALHVDAKLLYRRLERLLRKLRRALEEQGVAATCIDAVH